MSDLPQNSLPLKVLSWFLPVISGGALALIFPPFDWTGLMWVALVPLLASIHLFGASELSVWKRFRRAFARGYLCGLVYFGLSLSWLSEVVAASAASWMLPVPTLAVSLFLALYPALWSGVVATFANPLCAGRKQAGGAQEESSLERKVRERVSEYKQRAKWSLGNFAWGEALVGLRCGVFAAALWVLCEWLRGWVFTGFGWNALGAGFYRSLYLAQAADLVGEVGLAFLPVLMNVVLFDVGRRLVAEVWRGRFRAHLDFGIAVGLVAATFLYGASRLEQMRSWETTPVRVLGIQEMLPLDLSSEGMDIEDVFPRYLKSTESALQEIENQQREAIERGEELELWSPDWVIWPESAQYFPLWRSAEGQITEMRQWNVHYYQKGIRPLQERYGPFAWFTGINEYVGDGVERSAAFNALWIVDDRVEDSKSWGKRHLVPFGEYIPFKDSFPFLQSLFEAASGGNPYGGDFERGHNESAILQKIGDRDIGVIGAICYEDSVPRVLRPFITAGESQVIVNVTNDGWFGDSAAAYQHFAKASFRAIEFRRPLVRVANTGITSVVGFDGSLSDSRHPDEGERWLMSDEEGPFVKGYLKATVEVPSKGPISLYALYGDWFVCLCAGLVLALGLRQVLGHR